MKKFTKAISGKLLGWGFLLLAATNIVVLGGVAANRSGEPEARLVLSERELQPSYSRTRENSGLGLRLVWRIANDDDEGNGYRYWRAPAWFDAAKIAELGLDAGDNAGAGNDRNVMKKPVPKEVFIVLQLDGEPYRQALTQAAKALAKEKEAQEKTPVNLTKTEETSRKEKVKAAQQRHDEERLSSSRLFAVDAGLDPQILREKYPDRLQFIVAKGVVEAANHGVPGKKEMRGRVNMLLIENIHVPLEFRASYEAAMARKSAGKSDNHGSHYTIELVYGSRFEPWIASLGPTKVASDQEID